MKRAMDKKRGDEQKHTTGRKKKHNFSRLMIILALLVIAGIIISPLFTERGIKVEAPSPIEPTSIVKPSPEPEESPAEEVFEETKKEEAIKKSSEEQITQVTIRRDSLEPNAVTVEEGTIVSWINGDTRQHKIACYINGKRIFLGESLGNKGGKSEYKFKDSGEYLCLDAVFGSRMDVIVKPIPLSKITGGTIRELPSGNIILTGLLVFVMLLAISIYLYVNKKI